MSRILTAYFSAGGTTAAAAKRLAGAAGSDLYEIKPAVPYTKEDTDYMDKQSRSSLETADKDCRPALADKNADIASYDKIFLGFPIWWYYAPKIIYTFLESYDFSGKTIILFATSGGSGFGDTARELKKLVSADTVLKEGRIMNAKISDDALKNWVSSF